MEAQPLLWPLWIMAIVSVIQLLIVLGAAAAAWIAYNKVTAMVADLEARQIAPLREKVDAILVDVKSITARVSHQTERVDHAINGTMERVDETAARVRAGVHDRVSQVAGIVRGVRAVLISLLQRESHA
jgi:pyruvate-formate lyase-activating enzyme